MGITVVTIIVVDVAFFVVDFVVVGIIIDESNHCIAQIIRGRRLPPLQSCPEPFNVLLNRCWAFCADHRPSAHALIEAGMRCLWLLLY